MSRRTRVLLVGSGHAHALVLRHWAKEPAPGVELTVVTDRPDLVYSGMTPGVIAGEYTAREAVIDAEGLCRRAGAGLVVGTVRGIDAAGRKAVLADGAALGYDIASLDVGSTVKEYDQPEVRATTVSPRDPRALLERLPALAERQETPAPSVVVVGGGAAGVEVAAAVRRRLPHGRVTLVEANTRLMSGYREAVGRRVSGALRRRGVVVRLGVSVKTVDAGAVTLAAGEGAAPEDGGGPGETLPSDLTVWATGAAPRPLLRASGLPTDEGGFVRVDARLLVRGRDDLFAVGDCASLEGHALPKAGVHAVRQGPVLFRNLKAVAETVGGPSGATAREADLGEYEPQRDFLTLLNLGDGTALGTKWGLVAEGRWVRWIKDRIDRRFVARFRD